MLTTRRRAERRARAIAKNEVLALVRESPSAAYGLYCLLMDAELLSRSAKAELEPLMRKIEHRLTLGEEPLPITLPLPFEPLTDVEFDTLTLVIGRALKEFAHQLPTTDPDRRLPELLGLNALLRQHVQHTASLTYEVTLNALLEPLLRHCGDVFASNTPDGGSVVEPGDFFQINRPGRSKRHFYKAFLSERNLAQGSFVRIDEVWSHGYHRARFLLGGTQYSQAWVIEKVRRSVPQKGHLTAIHAKEGTFFRPHARYAAAIDDLIELYRAHTVDLSADPKTYQPTGKTG